MKISSWWRLSTAISFILLAVLINSWVQMNKFETSVTQLVSEQDANDFLIENWENRLINQTADIEPTIKLKTGLFIQSLKFISSSEINLTGYIWQRYKDGIHDAIKPDQSEAGFILPEQVNTGNDIEPHEVYRVRNGDEETIGWYFEATLRQPFNYAKYPFDHKTVWVRMWPQEFSRNIILVPDFEAYKSTGLNDTFGIEENIVLGTWRRENTYFGYELKSYDTDFGIYNYVGSDNFPEFHYNFILKRKFENAFIIYLLPLFLVASLLFASILMKTTNEKLLNRFGYSLSGFIGTSSALFFVVMLAHIQLREQFAGAGTVYIEYFYILMYVLLIIATINAFIFSIRPKNWCGIILYKDNLIPKVAYWPVVLGSLNIITWNFM